ncbi:MAG TPA: hypothetical protein VEG40_11630 [Gaiellaceae bacterium]|nr:hypothetical protein [Gaiellaceae bacterium]
MSELEHIEEPVALEDEDEMTVPAPDPGTDETDSSTDDEPWN